MFGTRSAPKWAPAAASPGGLIHPLAAASVLMLQKPGFGFLLCTFLHSRLPLSSGGFMSSFTGSNWASGLVLLMVELLQPRKAASGPPMDAILVLSMVLIWR